MGLVLLGLTIIFAPISITLLLTAMPEFDGKQTLMGVGLLAVFGLYIYGTLGVVLLVIGLCLRQAGMWLIGLGLTLIVVPLVIVYRSAPSIFFTHLIGVWRHPVVEYFGSYGVVVVMIGLWVRHRSLRQIMSRQ